MQGSRANPGTTRAYIDLETTETSTSTAGSLAAQDTEAQPLPPHQQTGETAKDDITEVTAAAVSTRPDDPYHTDPDKSGDFIDDTVHAYWAKVGSETCQSRDAGLSDSDH